MKNVLIVLTLCFFGISTVSAQTPAAAPAKAEVKKAAEATKTAVQGAPKATKMGVKRTLDTTKTKMHTTHAKVEGAVGEAKTGTAAAAKKSTRKVGNAAKQHAGEHKMMYKCPAGDALSDTGGKCPKCGTEMVAIAGGKKPMSKAAAKPAATKVEMKKEAVKQ